MARVPAEPDDDSAPSKPATVAVANASPLTHSRLPASAAGISVSSDAGAQVAPPSSV
jgi:hypothetical protein